MADRTTKVTLTAQVSGYLAGMDAAAKKTQAFADGSKAKLDAQRDAMNRVGAAAIGLGAVIGAGVAYAVKSFSDFDAKMSQVKTLSHATASQMSELSAAALHMGQSVGFSATQTADAEIELVKAGVSLKDIMGGALKGSLDLAAAGQVDVGKATEIATIALTQFKLQGKDVPHVADLLAAGADKALGGVSDLGEALKSGGLVASQFGVSLDETVGTLSAFANAGLLGETAGTDLRQMLLKLANPSADAAKTMSKLGINIYDASGKFVGMSDLAGQLSDKMGKLDPATRNAALATIFGSRAIAGANVLYKEGAKGIADWTTKVNDSGFAAQQARGKMDNLQGDLNKLGAAFQTDLIEAGSNANGALRGLAQGATTVVKAVGNLPAPVLGVGLGIAALTAGVLLLGGTVLIAIPKIAAFKVALSDLNLTGKGLAGTIGKGGVLIAGLMALTSAFTNMASTGSLTADKLAEVDSVMANLNSINLNTLFQNAGTQLADGTKQADKFKEALNNIASGNFFENQSNATKFVDGLTFGLTHLSDVYKDNEARLKEMGQTLGETAKSDLPKATDSFKQFVDAAGGGKEAIRQLLVTMPDYKAALIELASSQGKTLSQQELFNLAVGKGALANALAVQPTNDNSQALQDMADQADAAKQKVSDLADAISNFGKGAFDQADASRAFEQAVSDASDAVAKNGATLDITTQKGRDNSAALEQVAKTALGVASAQANAGATGDTLSATMVAGRAAFVNAATAAGLTADAANRLADQYGLIPANVTTAVSSTGVGDAIANAQAIAAAWAAAQGTIARTQALANSGQAIAKSPYSIARAGGGPVYGPGTSTSDSVDLRASNGEFVINADAYAKNKALVEAINSGVNLSQRTPAPQRYAREPRQYASSSSEPGAVNVQVVSNGIDLSGYLDVFVDGKLQRADSASARRISGGVR